ncbi:entericidin A/B family lipoprotein [Terricaulis sp.]|uniref:entericidin A/B family lipoprotein n=1 Tax=Terricaulis sp. TaxID=2768686 RepID=UPI002AC5A842|nr:entericidin A/B family lipoprotein [Terricaulis sp.]MDZ4690332.1 entericidin A/B family lipoprotein [Terricaulis sp.]
MSKNITTTLVAMAALVGAGSLVACNTVEGVGEDVQKAGTVIEQTAQETNDGNPNTP